MSSGPHVVGGAATKLGAGARTIAGALGAVLRVRQPQRPPGNLPVLDPLVEGDSTGEKANLPKTGFFRTRLFKVLLALALVAMLVSTAFVALASTGGCATPTITWVGSTSTGSWHIASNWVDSNNVNRVPGAGDHVCIPDVANTSAVTFTTGTSSVATLESAESFTVSGGALNLTSTTDDSSEVKKFTLSGGTLGGAGNLTIPAGGSASWSGSATMTGPGRTIISGADGSQPAATLTMSSPTTRYLLDRRVLQNDGETAVTGTGPTYSGQGAVVENSGAFDFKTDADIHYNYGGTKTRFENTGTLKKSAGTASTEIEASVDNDGSVEVSSGTLDLPGGTDANASDTSTGDFLATSGTTLRFGGDHRLSGAGSSVSGSGTIVFLNGTTNVGVESYAADGTTTVSGGNVTFNAALSPQTLNISGGTANFNSPAGTTMLNLSGGTLGGSGNLTVLAGGSATWSGSATMTGPGRTVISGASGSDPAAALNISGTATRYLLDRRVLQNDGTTTYSGTGPVYSGQGAVIENSGAFDFKTDADIHYNYGGTKTRFENTGTLKKSAGTASTDVEASVDNDGSVEVSSGALYLSGGTDDATTSDTSAGDFAVASGTTLRFGGNHRLSGTGSSVTGAGAIEFPYGTTSVNVDEYTASGATTVSGANATFATSFAVETLNVTGGTANFNAPAATTKNLNLSGGTLGGSGNLTVPAGGTATWSGSATMTGPGRTVVSGADGSDPAATLAVSGTSVKYLLDRRVLQNDGTTTYSGTGPVYSGQGAVVENSGTFDFKTDADIHYNYGGTKTRFENTGTLKKTAGTASTDIEASVDNDGSVEVSSGTLYLSGGTDANTSDTSTGDFLATSGTTLRFGGDHRLSGTGSSVVGAGAIEFPYGTTSVNVGEYSVSGTTSVTGAAATFGTPVTTEKLNVTGGAANFNASTTARNFNLSGGTLGGSASLTIPAGGTATWSGGEMSGPGRTVVSGASGSDPAATLAVSGTSVKYLLDRRVLQNDGATTYSGTGPVYSGQGAAIENSGVFDMKSDADVHYNYGGTQTRFENTGTLKKSAGTESTDMYASVDNDGSVEVSSGMLNLYGGTDTNTSDTSTGDFVAGVGATLRFSSDHRLSGAGSSVTGTGTVSFPSGTSTIAAENYDVAGTTSISGGTVSFNAPAKTRTLDLSSGSLRGSGTVSIPAGGSATWSGGEMTGPGRTVVSGASGSNPAATLEVSNPSVKYLLDRRTLQNDGNTAFTGPGSVYSGQGAVVENAGTFDFRTDADVHYNYGGTKTRFENSGTLKKTSGTASSDIGAAIANDGTVEVASGTLYLNGGLDNFSSTGGVGTLTGGTYMVKSNSTLKFTGADIDVNAAEIVLDGLGSQVVDQFGGDAIDNLYDNDGSLTIGSDRDLRTLGALTNEGSVSIGANSILTTTGDYTQTAGSTTLEETTSKLAVFGTGRTVKVQGGMMEGVGTVEPPLNASGGRVAPGLTLGTLKTTSSYTQGSDGMLEVEIGGTTPGTGHDRLEVGTTASLGGTLDIVTPSGYTPTAGDSFTILQCGTADCRTGEFRAVEGANLGPGLEYRVIYNASNVTLEFGEVNEAPVAVADTATTSEDTSATIDVLGNDTDADGDTLTVASFTQPAHGQVTCDINDPDGDCTYTPEGDFNGPDSFAYTVYDGTVDGNQVTVNITVTAVNDAPVIDPNGDATGAYEATFTEDDGPVSAADSAALSVTDVDSDTLASATVKITNLQDGDDESLDADTSGATTTITKAYDPATGELALTGEASKSDYENVLRTVQYDNTSQDPGTTDRSIAFAANDGTDDSESATTTISVEAVNDAPTVVLNGEASAEEGDTKTYTYEVNDPDSPAPDVAKDCGEGATKTETTAENSFDCTFTDGPATPEVSATATDSDNENGGDSVQVAVANVAPAVELTGDAAANEGDTKTYTYTITDPGDDTVSSVDTSCGDNGQKVPGSDTNTDTSGSFECLFPDGPASFTVSAAATDSDGDAGTANTLDVTVSNVAPSISLSGPATAEEGETATYTYTTTDPGDDPAITTSCGPGGTKSDNPEENSFDCTFSDGPSETTVSVTADDGDDTGSDSEQVTVDNVAPTATPANDGPVEEGSPVTVSFTEGADASSADEEAGLRYEFDCEGAAFADAPDYEVASTSASATCTFDDDGEQTVSARVIDKDNGATGYTTLVTVENAAPTATFEAPESVTEGDDITVSLSDPVDPSPDDTAAGFEYAFDCGSGYGAFGSSASTTCPATDDGAITVKGKIKDKDGAETGYTADVTVENAVPAVTVTGDQTISEGGTFSGSGSFTDAGAGDTHTATVNYGDGSGEQPLTLEADKTFSLSHAYADNGSYKITVAVTDDENGEGTGTFTVTVENADPVVSAGEDASISEGGTFSGGGSFTDAGGDTHTATVDYGDGSASEDLTLAADGSFDLSHEYADEGDGSYEVEVTVTDDDGGEGSDNLRVTVGNANPVVVASADDDTITEGSAFTGSGSSTDPGAEDTHTATVNYGDGSGPQPLDLNDDKTFSLDHTYADDGAYEIKVTVTDDDGGEGTATLAVAVENAAPVVSAPSGEQTSGEGESKSFQLGSFTDPGSDGPWQVSVDWGDGSTEPPFEVASPGSLGEKPHAYADDGTYTVEVTVAEAGTGAPYGTASFTVEVSNVAPAANAQEIEVAEDDGGEVVTLSGSDAPGSDSLGYEITGLPARGALYEGEGTNGARISTASAEAPHELSGEKVTYVPEADYYGSDGFDFRADDGDADSNAARVAINVTEVNDAPSGADDTKTTQENVPLVFPASDLLTNDDEGANNESDQTLTVTRVGGAVHGDVSLSDDGRITFTPETDYNGNEASFKYTVCDDGTTDGQADPRCQELTATVKFAVSSVNSRPTASDGAETMNEDGDPITVDLASLVSDTETSDADLEYTIVRKPASEQGTLTQSGPSTFVFDPAEHFNGKASFTYTVTDRGDPDNCGAVSSSCETAETSEEKTVTITVNPVNDAPVAGDKRTNTNEDTPKDVTLAATDADGDALAYTVVSNPQHGTLSGSGPNLTYTPEGNYAGPDAFTYKANDGAADSNVATVSVTVATVNDAPVAKDDTAETDEGTAKNVDVLANDSDAEDDALSVESFTQPSHGTATKNSDGTLKYTPENGYHGPDSFEYTVSDGNGGTDTAAVTITVNGANDATRPTIECGAADDLWHKDDVEIECTATDGGSGLANPDDARFALSTNVSADTETANASTGSRKVCDNADNCVTAGPISGNKVDKKAPTITINTPDKDGAEYKLKQAVASSFECNDGGSGKDSCAGPNTLDTSFVGQKTFTATTTDEVGNEASSSRSYRVVYDFEGFFSPVENLPTLNPWKAGLPVPVRFSLGGDQGRDIFAAGYPKSQRIDCVSKAPIGSEQSTASADPSAPRYVANVGQTRVDQYLYTWTTSRTWAGSCRQLVVKLKDGTEHKADFKFKQ